MYYYFPGGLPDSLGPWVARGTLILETKPKVQKAKRSISTNAKFETIVKMLTK
jgi:hypothetical protein